MKIISPETGLLFWTFFSFLSVFLTIAALIIVLKSSFKDSTAKLIWALVIILIPTVGVIPYFLIGRKQRENIV